MTLSDLRPVIVWICVAILAAAFIGVAAWAWRSVSEARSAAARAAEDVTVAKLAKRAERQGRHRGDSEPFPAVAELVSRDQDPPGTGPIEDHLRQMQRQGPLRQVGKWGGPQ